MQLLAIETTGHYASVALYKDGKISVKNNNQDMSHLQQLIPMVQAVMEEGFGTAVKAPELDAIAVSKGPGSFTGIRIGMATAKGLAQIWNKPLICVPTLASFAFGESLPKAVLISPLFDARRSQVYAGCYKPGDRNSLVPDGAYTIDEYLEKLSAVAGGKKVLFFGDGIKPYQDKFTNLTFEWEFAPEESRYQKAENVAKLAALMFAAGETEDAFSAEPEYLRLAEAERKLRGDK